MKLVGRQILTNLKGVMFIGIFKVLSDLQQPGTMIQAGVVHPMQGAPPDFQGLAWFACLCCCWPLGLIAIFKSNEVHTVQCNYQLIYIYIYTHMDMFNFVDIIHVCTV